MESALKNAPELFEHTQSSFILREELSKLSASQRSELYNDHSKLEAFIRSINSKYAGKSLYGQKFSEIGEFLSDGSFKGKYSKRVFDPNRAGGIIKKLDWTSAKVTKGGIAKIKEHIYRLDYTSDELGMIERLEKIESGKIPITDFDKRFYTHELDEFSRYETLGFKTTHYRDIPDSVWYDAHAATLEDYQLYERMTYNGESVLSLYHPSIVK